mgnify:CR=1 FL=1
MRRRRRRVLRKISLDQVPELEQEQRPDYALLLDDGEVVVVEETGRPEPRDIDRVAQAALALKKGTLPLRVSKSPSAITGVVHYRRRDTVFGRHLSSLQKRFWDKHRILLLGVSCQRELEQRLRITFGKGK